MIFMLKGPFQKRYLQIEWKRDNKKNHFMKLCHNLANTWTIYIVILAAFILPLKKAFNFILAFEMMQTRSIILNQ